MIRKYFLLSCLSVLAVTAWAEDGVAWHENFAISEDSKLGKVPELWKFDGSKYRVPKSQFSHATSEEAVNKYILKVDCPKSTGALLTKPEVDLNRFPILRWRWRVNTFPKGADGRKRETDDQPLVIYVATGSVLRQRSIAYRWDGLTPVGASGKVRYAGGMMQVHYITLRNEASGAGKWFIESRDIARDFKEIYGEVPKKFVISVGGNSQYTQSHSSAELDFIELRTKKNEK